MATKKVGALIKEARTAADLTQEKLADKMDGKGGVTAADISKVERGEADFTNAQLKTIAKICGVTQSSLLNAPKNLPENKKTEAKKTEAKKTEAKKTEAKKTEAKKPAAKKTAAPKVPANANTSMKVTTTEKKLVEAYREAGSDMKKIAMKLLKGEYSETVTGLLNATSGSASSGADLASLISDGLGKLFGGKSDD